MPLLPKVYCSLAGIFLWKLYFMNYNLNLNPGKLDQWVGQLHVCCLCGKEIVTFLNPENFLYALF